VGAQEALRARLTEEVTAGRTTPSAAWTADYGRMKDWRAQAGTLFRAGDYLHAEYAARNASLAARGFAQTAANTSDPKLVEAGQIFYFNVHPQPSGTEDEKSNLTPTDLVAMQTKSKQTTLTVTVSNPSTVAAQGVAVQLLDGGTVIGTSAPVTVPAGETTNVSVAWSTTGIKGDRSITAVVDPANTVAESNEADNRLARTITVKGNKVTNGSFESGSTQPDSWTSNGATYDTSGAHSSDGTDAIGLKPLGSITSSAIPVQAGATYQLAATAVTGGTPRLSLSYLDAAGKAVGAVTLLTSGLTGSLTVPAGATQLKITLTAPINPFGSQTIWVDDIWLT